MRQQFDDVPLVGDRFILRAVRLSDADAIAAGAADPRTLQWLPLPRP